MKKGTVLIKKEGIVGKVFGNKYLVLKYFIQTWSKTKGGERSRHWYACQCTRCGKYKILERQRLLNDNLPLCECRKKENKK